MDRIGVLPKSALFSPPPPRDCATGQGWQELTRILRFEFFNTRFILTIPNFHATSATTPRRPNPEVDFVILFLFFQKNHLTSACCEQEHTLFICLYRITNFHYKFLTGRGKRNFMTAGRRLMRTRTHRRIVESAVLLRPSGPPAAPARGGGVRGGGGSAWTRCGHVGRPAGRGGSADVRADGPLQGGRAGARTGWQLAGWLVGGHRQAGEVHCLADGQAQGRLRGQASRTQTRRRTADSASFTLQSGAPAGGGSTRAVP